MRNKVYIIGVGPGSEDYLLPIAKRKIEEADCLIGAKRLLGLFRHLGKEELKIEGHFDASISYIKKYKQKKKIAVLISGDPGVYSLLDRLSSQLNKDDYAVIPGISAVSLAFARCGESWYNAKIISLHGRTIKNLACAIAESPKTILFTDHNSTPDKIAKSLLEQGVRNLSATVLENLSYPNERVIKTDLLRLSKIRGWGLCVVILEIKKQEKKEGMLYGIGLGPGDPGLVTLRAKEILERVDRVFVPKGNEDSSSWARQIVEAVVTTQKNFVELTFPMTTDKAILNKFWSAAATKIITRINQGKEVAFVTIGDPGIYSTYIYLLRTLKRNFPKIEVETVPGISAFNAASAKTNLALAEGREKLAVIPVRRDLKGLKEALSDFDSVALMKVGSKLDKVLTLLKEMGLLRKAVLLSRLGHAGEKIIHDLTSVKDKKIGYLSVILVKKGL